MDRFLGADNWNKSEDNHRPTYILHTIEIKMLIEIIPYEDVRNVNMEGIEFYRDCEYRNIDGMMEFYILAVRDLYSPVDTMDAEIRAQITNNIKKAWKWYKSYLIREDGNIGPLLPPGHSSN